MKKFMFVILLLILCIPIAILGFKSASNMPVSNTTETVDPPPILLEQAYVKRVVDGDTIIATIDGQDYRVRMIGMDTPESTTQIEPYGKEASDYTKSRLTGKTVYLEKDVRDTDQYDRLLRYIWLEKPSKITEIEIREKLFNAELLLEGYAQLFTYPPDVKYISYFTQFEKEAKQNEKGLWGI